ncbi:hypothetical protein HBN50_10505 [Halobacteriovorax sp. GB3]|uniref:hypothetical protein n=1 Tax=Halobacteriovorax sp. GB3 TaxID=2719615 RepID=UPI0023616BF5|nr:hypothetical protein [Halobacteriovorax sp. GB3]MDD0853532.1 hypothetical protein [Halobacteriovorax sp. GB3]
MKWITLIFLGLNIGAQAQLINLNEEEIYLGRELYMGKPTGASCYVQVKQILPLESKGRHCHQITARIGFTSKNEKHYKEDVTLYSRITNYHEAQYPHVKTCAERNLEFRDDRYFDVDIHGEDTTHLYNQIFSAEVKAKGQQQHFFLSFSAKEKTLSRAKLHTLSWFSEKDWECVNLINASPR